MANSGICANLVDPTTRDSYKPEDAPFCKTVSKDGKPFNEYLMLQENSNLMESITEGVVPWLNVSSFLILAFLSLFFSSSIIF